MKKVQKEGRDESTRRLSCCRKIVVKRLVDYSTSVAKIKSANRSIE